MAVCGGGEGEGGAGTSCPPVEKKKPAIKLVCTNERERSPGERRRRRPPEIFRRVVSKLHNNDSINV